MPSGGIVTLKTEACVLDGMQAPGLSGSFVRIAVTDTGHGMTEADQQRAFDPFFTTKEVGKGSGLGLSHVYGLAQQSGGTAVIKSQVGQGTTVMIYLPAGHGALEEDDVAPLETAKRAPAAEGASVVLVEDDDNVRDTVADILASAGCEVRAFGSPREVLATVTGSDRIHLMVVDYAMPDMRGDELVEALRRRGVAAPAVFMTGYTNSEVLKAEAWVLHKPFRASELLGLIETAIMEHSG